MPSASFQQAENWSKPVAKWAAYGLGALLGVALIMAAYATIFATLSITSQIYLNTGIAGLCYLLFKALKTESMIGIRSLTAMIIYNTIQSMQTLWHNLRVGFDPEKTRKQLFPPQ